MTAWGFTNLPVKNTEPTVAQHKSVTIFKNCEQLIVVKLHSYK